MCRMCSLDSAAPLHRHMHETRDSIQRSGMPETGFDRHHHSAPPRRPRLTTGTCISVTPPRDGRGLAAAAAHPFPYKARAPAKARPRAPRSATLRSSPPVQRYSTLLSAPQKLSIESAAVPRLIQCSCGTLLGISMDMTKLVEWPVVESTPKRDDVLYTGQK